MTDKKPEDLLEDLKSELSETKNKFAQLKQDKEEIITGIKTDIKSWYKKWIKIIFGSFSVLMIIGLSVSVYKIYTNVTNSITVKFAEPQIAKTLNDVAENQAKEIIETRLNPAIQIATITVNKKIDSFETDLQKFINTYGEELKKLKKEVEYIKSRNMALRFADKAIAIADSESFEKLENIYKSTSDEDLKMAALSEIFRVKHSFVNTTRIEGVEIAYTNPETGKSFKDNDIPTEVLIKDLSYHTEWQVRGRAAELLKRRKEKQVPKVLLNAIQNDKNLEVRAKAMKSFENITGFKNADVFQYAPAKDWWDKNKKDINLKDLQTIESVLEKNNDDESKN